MPNDIINNKAFLGRGWAFPIQFTKGYNSAEMSEFEQDIQQSLIILLSTIKGERIMKFDFGTTIHNLLFEPMDVSTGTLISNEIKNAILFHEPRVFVDNVQVNQSEVVGYIELLIDYTIISTNTRYNLVYPYYINEGTDAQL